ncbi:autotransporter outer membrane beta-barrel domain-containing protein, partial [Mesorhizobium sp.]|uniref:autotransporter domain-containing protein n=1 Tax=Mesorhizobium sp. TaxID=1871066 RepID=UPI0025D16720
MAAIYGRHLIDTLHERVGEEEQLKGRTDLRESETFNGAWGRLIGHWGHSGGHELGIYGGGPEFDYTFGALQVGMDIYGKEYDNGARDHTGLYLAVGHGEVDVTHNLAGRVSFKGGDDEFDAFTLGGYWTRFDSNNWYLDGVVQGTWYDVTTKSLRDTLLGFPDQNINGFGFAASLEGGYPFYFGDGWQIEPQGQLIFQTIRMNSFNDGAAEVRFDDLDSLIGRIGARLARTWAVDEEAQGNGDGTSARLATVWGRVNLWHEFLDGDVTTEISSADGFVPFTADLEQDLIELGIGGSLQLTPTTT